MNLHVLGRWMLPYPPSTNNLYPHVPTPRGKTIRVKSSEYERWIVAAQAALNRAPVVVPPRVPLALLLRLDRPAGRTYGDNDNRVKACQDLLAHTFSFNDYRIASLFVTRGDPTPDGRVVVVLATGQLVLPLAD